MTRYRWLGVNGGVVTNVDECITVFLNIMRPDLMGL